ncbi:restriction endonuclease subunit S [Verrucomicrobiales bacterium BCK34]|nr:restriction endonuclease subunit S [Verrucomicrobiales bacterium BCK34]
MAKQNEKKRALEPELRFPEFNEEWEEENLGRLFKHRQEQGDEDLPLLSLTAEKGIIPQSESGRKDNSNADKSRYLRVAKGDIAYNTMRMWEGRSALSSLEGLVSPAYTVCAPRSKADSTFFSHYIKTASLIELFNRNSQGLTKDTYSLKFPSFAKIRVHLPELPEQQKIADCLGSLDDLIAAHSAKLDALQDHKKGLLQQLFPAEGETTPKLRFPGFEGEWGETQLGKIVSFQSGGTPSKANSAFWEGTIPWVSAKDMKHLFLEDAQDHISQTAIDNGAKVAPRGSVLILIRGMTLFKDVPICVLEKPMSFNQDVKALRAKAGLEQKFLPFLLLGNKRRMLGLVDSAGHGTGRIDTEELKALFIFFPKSAEQQKIAACLTSLDGLISAETNQIAALKTHKKALMQQLFPSPE